MIYKEYSEKGEVCNDCGLALDLNNNCYSQTCINNIVVSDTAEITNNL
tara:strand:- start:1380 stop:1523 length:144 start_codon:yes stop_codon:yes gene_type:complete